MIRKIKIATRKSRLALWQAHYVRDRLLEASPKTKVEISGMTTEGDRILGARNTCHGLDLAGASMAKPL